jgi:hypothetical protein
MQRLDLIQATAANPEIAVLRASVDEHKLLHDRTQGKEFVNKNHVFTKDVRELALAPHATPGQDGEVYWLVIVAHLPQCFAQGACVSIPNESR